MATTPPGKFKFHFSASGAAPGGETANAAKIVRAARRLLIREGFATFSARGVAKQAKMSLGALQYCYRTKRALIAATLEHVVDGYESGYATRLRTAPASGEARFLAILDFLIDDIWDQNSRKLFLPLWGMSTHDRMIAGFLHEMYEFHVARMSGFIGEANPRLSPARRRQLAVHIIAMLEGLLLFSQRPGRNILARSEMTRTTRETVISLIGLLPRRTEPAGAGNDSPESTVIGQACSSSKEFQ
jgi:AcrR family transcriptional regulator